MKKLIFISLCLLSGGFSQAQTVAIGTTSSVPVSNMYVLTSSTYTSNISNNGIILIKPYSLETKTITGIQKSKVKSPGNWFVLMTKWFNYNYDKMRESVNQWLYLEINNESYRWEGGY